MSKLHQPIWNRTHTLIARLAEHYSFGKIAQWCGIDMKTTEAWGREVESDINPSGTGKRNPFDTVKRLIGKAFVEDAGLAREMAEIFPSYVDELENRSGEEFVRSGGNLLEILAHSAQEHADILASLVDQHADLDTVHQEYIQFQVVMNKFASALGTARRDAMLPVRQMAQKAVAAKNGERK